MYERILVATDGSPLSKKAAKGAIALAAATGAELVALHVVPRYPMSWFEGAVGISPHDIAATEKAWNDNAQDLLDAVCAQAKAARVKAKPVIAHSDLVGQAILGAAKKHKCGLIVMASHGRKGLARVLLGSETLQVLTHGTTPVLVLR
jgi:nucleotide-binding universal stress UspA family protein